MVTPVAPCRAFIVYRNRLFAEGVRSVLAKRRTVQIVGMARNVTTALKAVQSLQPDVIIMEESAPGKKTDRLEALLDGAVAGRVVRVSLDHYHATVYHRQHVASANAADLVKAIRGVARARRFPGPNGQSGEGQSRTRITPAADVQMAGVGRIQPSARAARKPEGRLRRARKRQ
jgi:DNA-binding NarL/FixJ family response regulator